MTLRTEILAGRLPLLHVRLLLEFIPQTVPRIRSIEHDCGYGVWSRVEPPLVQ